MVVPGISVKEWLKSPYVKNRIDNSLDTVGFPTAIRQMFNETGAMGIQNAVMQSADTQHTTKLPGRGGPPFADLFVQATFPGGRIAMIVEAKPNLTLYKTADKWLHSNENQANRLVRLEGLCDILGIDVGDAACLQYQFLHRTAAALIEAEKLDASTAVMLVVSSSPDQKWIDAFAEFGSAMGVTVKAGQFVDVGMRHGSRLLLGWLNDTA